MNKSFKTLILSALIAGASMSAFASGPDISGYFDMAIVAPEKKEAYWRQQHLNILMNHSIDKFKFFAEIEFEDALDIDLGRTPQTLGTTKTGVGRIFIERAYAEYSIIPELSARFGQLLHSTLYYENHYPSIIINYTDPLTRKVIFDYNIKGATLFGEKMGVIYDVWTGKGPSSTTAATNESGTNFGGKLGYHLTGSKLDMKLSVLGATYTWDIEGEKTKAYGAELSLNYGNFQLWSEYGIRGADIKKSGATASGKDKQMAGYVIGSYAFDLGSNGEISPFLMLDQYKRFSTVGSTLQRATSGFAYRPIPTITVKLDYSNSISGKINTDGTANSKLVDNKVAAQLVYFYN